MTGWYEFICELLMFLSSKLFTFLDDSILAEIFPSHRIQTHRYLLRIHSSSLQNILTTAFSSLIKAPKSEISEHRVHLAIFWNHPDLLNFTDLFSPSFWSLRRNFGDNKTSSHVTPTCTLLNPSFLPICACVRWHIEILLSSRKRVYDSSQMRFRDRNLLNFHNWEDFDS